MNFALTPHKKALTEIMELYSTDNDNIVVRVFIDLRNAHATFFDENQLAMMIKDPIAAIRNFVKSTLDFMNYMRKLPYELEFHYFYEVGRSEYHKKISKEYKSSRGGSYQILQERQIKQAKDLNIKAYEIFYNLSRNLPEVKCYKLNYFEADFIPHYIINTLGVEKCERYDNKIVKNIIMSNDKDMLQSLDKEKNVIQLRKNFRQRKTVVTTFDNMYYELLKETPESIDIIESDENYIADILSIAGDKEDDVYGIPGIGYKKAHNILKFFNCRTEKILEKDIDPTELDVKYIKKNITSMLEQKDKLRDNLKMVDFDIISQHIPLKTMQGIKKEYFDKEISDMEILKADLDELGIEYNSYVEAMADSINNTYTSKNIEEEIVSNPYNVVPPSTQKGWTYK